MGVSCDSGTFTGDGTSLVVSTTLTGVAAADSVSLELVTAERGAAQDLLGSAAVLLYDVGCSSQLCTGVDVDCVADEHRSPETSVVQ